VNKADRPGAAETVRDIEQMLDLAGELDRAPGWRPPIVQTVGTSGEGIDALWKAVLDHRGYLESTGELKRRRRARLVHELRGIVHEQLLHAADARCRGPEFDALVDALVAQTVDPSTAARTLLAT
jgi:LAO/AO transport system kinase